MIDRNEVLIHATTWMHLKNIMVRERNRKGHSTVPFTRNV